MVEGLNEGMEAYNWESEFGNRFAKRKVLVTGATGFIGWHLCESLVAMDADVYGVACDADRKRFAAGCRAIASDLKDAAATQAMVEMVRPSLVFHLAGLVTAKRDLDLVIPMLENNLVGTVNLLLALNSIGVDRIVIAGSSEEPLTVTDVVPTSPYAAAKFAATLYCQMFHRLYNLPVVVVRPFASYGPRQDRTKLIPYTILCLLGNKNPQFSSGERFCDFVYVLDLLRGFLMAGIQPNLEGGIVELGTGKGTRVRELVELLGDLTFSSTRPLFGELPDRIDEKPVVADVEATRRQLHWESRWSLRDGLIETIEWYRKSLIQVNP